MTKPLAIDLFCGLGGWTDGLLAEGYDVVGFDIEQHVYGEHRYPAQLVLQDVLTLHGSQFKTASLIVASPPCQEFSYMAMPWSKAKARAAEYRSGKRDVKQLTALFDACFRIQREACEAAGRHIPLIVENVRGAIPWVGRSRWNFGSFHLWGDVPALMPPIAANGATNFHGHKNSGGSWFNIGSPGQKELAKNPVHALTKQATRPNEHAGVKHQASGAAWFDCGPAAFGSGTSARKVASAMIAKIPTVLARHIAQSFRPVEAQAALCVKEIANKLFDAAKAR